MTTDTETAAVDTLDQAIATYAGLCRGFNKADQDWEWVKANVAWSTTHSQAQEIHNIYWERWKSAQNEKQGWEARTSLR